MSDHDHQIGSVVTTITVETTTVTETSTEGDRTTVVTVTAMTSTGQTTIMIGTRKIKMTDTIRGIHVMIGETLTGDHTTIEGITTTVVGTLLKTNHATLTCPGPTHQHKRPGINHTPLPHTQIGLTPATRPQLPALSATNPVTTLPNAQQHTAERPPS